MMHQLTIVVATIVMLFGTPAALGGDRFTEDHEQTVEFPLPGTATLLFPQFDDQGCTRRLHSVTLSIGATVRTPLAVENESSVTIPSIEILVVGFVETTSGDLAVSMTFDELYLGGPLCPDDGVPMSGCDYLDFGDIAISGGDVDQTHAALLAYIGGGTIEVVTNAVAGAFPLGSHEASIYVDFDAEVVIRVTYEFSVPVTGDVDGDDDVDFTDLIRVLGAWGSCSACPEDLDCTGDVGATDLVTVLGAWDPGT